jgi:NAD(P)-dependent dehydrogenase (short-subunit alcohol dehydrogenase family)
VLVNGTTGGVGACAVRLAAADGLRVVATARPGEEETHVCALGATETVDWSEDDVAAVRGLHPDGVDGVVDLVSRDPAGSPSWPDSPGRMAPRSPPSVWRRAGAGEGRRTANVHSAGDPRGAAAVPAPP